MPTLQTSMLAAGLLATGWLFCAPVGRAAEADTATEHATEHTAEQIEFFETQVQPLLAGRCYKCHGQEKQRGELRLDSRGLMLLGGDSGPALTPGHPDESLLIEAIRYDSFEMPPDGQLPDAEIDILARWVEMGAPWPGSQPLPAEGVVKKPKITDEDRAFWSFQPLRPVEPPEVDDGGWSHNAIDQFIFRRLQAEGLTPAAEADRRTLIRRVYFDLVGLPPSPQEIDQFVADPSPQAYWQLVDRLLDSPRYGERWARHWLDLVRYAESDGFRQDAYRPHAWRYRDYVIRAFNDDKPYDRFVMEQLAGDEIAPEDPEALVATGFLRHGIYEYNQRDVRTQWSDMLNDVTDVTSDVFLGLGMSCARCHDHKFDPILQKDYYRLQAFFTPLLPRDDIPAATAEQQSGYQQRLAAWQQKTAELRQQIGEIERPHRQRVADSAIDKFPQDIRPMIRKDPAERSPLEHQLAELAGRQVTLEYERLDVESRLKDEEKEKYQALKKKLAEHEQDKPSPLPPAYVATDVGPEAPPTRIPSARQGEPIEPGFLTLLDPEPARVGPPPQSSQSTGRRSALARWLVSADNPLTARVMANRIWQYHFGRGLVTTSSDFGRLGEPPTHPELLDWLAWQFVEQGWSLKQMHRLIVNSATYRQTSLREAPEVARRSDAENRLLWRMPTRRLDAEQIRDAMLAVSGELDLNAGGPSVNASSSRRTIYTKVIRNSRDPLLDVFDAPDGFASCSQRNVTTTATQALLMINGPWPLSRAQSLARRLQREGLAGDELVSRAYRLAFGRQPTASERDSAVAFLQQQAQRAVQPEPDDRTPLVGTLPGRDGQAAQLEPGGPQDRLRVDEAAQLPAGDFTIEAFVLLRSLYKDASVRTIAAHWNNNQDQPGWSLGVTSTRSSYQPRNLILQLVGDPAQAGSYEVVPSGLHLELNKPYYVAAVVRAGDDQPGGATFYVQDLSGDEPPQVAQAAHQGAPHYHSPAAFVIGGRDQEPRHTWDGLIGQVRLTAAALPSEQLLIHGGQPDRKVVGWWQFDDQPGFYQDASGNGYHIQQHPPSVATQDAQQMALTDFCHVLLNANEFLYVD